MTEQTTTIEQRMASTAKFEGEMMAQRFGEYKGMERTVTFDFEQQEDGTCLGRLTGEGMDRLTLELVVRRNPGKPEGHRREMKRSWRVIDAATGEMVSIQSVERQASMVEMYEQVGGTSEEIAYGYLTELQKSL